MAAGEAASRRRSVGGGARDSTCCELVGFAEGVNDLKGSRGRESQKEGAPGWANFAEWRFSIATGGGLVAAGMVLALNWLEGKGRKRGKSVAQVHQKGQCYGERINQRAAGGQGRLARPRVRLAGKGRSHLVWKGGKEGGERNSRLVQLKVCRRARETFRDHSASSVLFEKGNFETKKELQ